MAEFSASVDQAQCRPDGGTDLYAIVLLAESGAGAPIRTSR